MTVSYTLVEGGVLRNDGVAIPNDEGNADWQAYLAWVGASNTPAQLTIGFAVDAAKAKLSEAASVQRSLHLGDRTDPVHWQLLGAEAKAADVDGTVEAGEYPLLEAEVPALGADVAAVATAVLAKRAAVVQKWVAIQAVLDAKLAEVDAATTLAGIRTVLASVTWPAVS